MNELGRRPPHLSVVIRTRTHLKGTKLKARKINQYGRESLRTTGVGGMD
jgi:hypothetical protein